MSELPATEGASPRYRAIETWSSGAILDALLESQMAAVAAVRPALACLEAAAEATAVRLRAGGRLAYCGAGTSGRIAIQDGAELPPTFDFPRERLIFFMAGGEGALVRAVEGAEDVTDGAEGGTLGALDVLVGLAASGATPYTLAQVRAAGAQGALTIGIANSPGPLLEAADHAILLLTGPEPIAGSTRLGAGTAQKVALNLFSTLVMTRLHRIYCGQMVDMVARNAKLRRRAVRMLCGLAATDPVQAEAALGRACGRLKVALLLLRGLTMAEAEGRLAEAQGDLHRVMAGFERQA